jgi:hypothetical protein
MIKEYLTYENNRNKEYRQLYMDIMAEVFGDEGILVAHHLCFAHTDSKGYFGVQEIPAADTLIFDHEIMGKVFGEALSFSIMQQLAIIPVEGRDAKLSEFYYGRAKAVAA